MKIIDILNESAIQINELLDTTKKSIAIKTYKTQDQLLKEASKNAIFNVESFLKQNLPKNLTEAIINSEKTNFINIEKEKLIQELNNSGIPYKKFSEQFKKVLMKDFEHFLLKEYNEIDTVDKISVDYSKTVKFIQSDKETKDILQNKLSLFITKLEEITKKIYLQDLYSKKKKNINIKIKDNTTDIANLSGFNPTMFYSSGASKFFRVSPLSRTIEEELKTIEKKIISNLEIIHTRKIRIGKKTDEERDSYGKAYEQAKGQFESIEREYYSKKDEGFISILTDFLSAAYFFKCFSETNKSILTSHKEFLALKRNSDNVTGFLLNFSKFLLKSKKKSEFTNGFVKKSFQKLIEDPIVFGSILPSKKTFIDKVQSNHIKSVVVSEKLLNTGIVELNKQTSKTVPIIDIDTTNSLILKAEEDKDIISKKIEAKTKKTMGKLFEKPIKAALQSSGIGNRETDLPGNFPDALIEKVVKGRMHDKMEKGDFIEIKTTENIDFTFFGFSRLKKLGIVDKEEKTLNFKLLNKNKRFLGLSDNNNVFYAIKQNDYDKTNTFIKVYRAKKVTLAPHQPVFRPMISLRKENGDFIDALPIEVGIGDNGTKKLKTSIIVSNKGLKIKKTKEIIDNYLVHKKNITVKDFEKYSDDAKEKHKKLYPTINTNEELLFDFAKEIKCLN